MGERTAVRMRKASTATRNTTLITVPCRICTETSMRIIRETGMITTGGVATTVAGGTVGGGPSNGPLLAIFGVLPFPFYTDPSCASALPAQLIRWRPADGRHCGCNFNRRFCSRPTRRC